MREKGASQRECQRRYRIGSSACQLILKRYKELGIPLEELEKISEAKLVESFYPPDKRRRKDIPLPDYEAIYERLMKKGSKANLFYLWTEYKLTNPDGYQYSQFVEYFNRFIQEHYAAKNVSMAVERVPGEKVYIDWIGDKPAIILNPETGELREVHVFVTTVGVSDYCYAELFENEKMANFVAGTVHALQMYETVPKYLVPDNASTAVTKHTKDELIINGTYQDLERFYDTIVLPPLPYKPKGKPTVEKHVQILETWLLEELKKKTFTSFAMANVECKRIVEDINNKPIKGNKYTRKEMYEMYDKPQMKKLTTEYFTTCDYVAYASVPSNYHVLYDSHYYSVNYTYYKKPVLLKATMTQIIICDENNRLICTHERSYKPYPKYITKSEHMPPSHKFYQEVNMHDGDYYRRWASAIGNDMADLINIVLHSYEHEEQAYNSCNGILHMCDEKPKYICNNAARKCIDLKSCKYSYFKRVLTDFMNENIKGEKESLPNHQNIRGKDYYK